MNAAAGGRMIYWPLPPADAAIMGEHAAEATSERIQGTITHRDELWDRVACLHGDYAHVVDEAIDVRHDEATGEVWLRGCFAYMLYRRSSGTVSQE